MFIHNINPVLFQIGPFQVRYYGLIFAFGFIIAYFLLKHLSRKKQISLDVDSFLLYLFFGVVIGARFFEVFVYNFSLYQDSFLSWFAIWNGGLSFHGGLLGAITAAYIFSRKNKMSFYKLADLTVIPAAIALALGRIANFINGELYGRVTDVPWGVKFPGVEGFRHPSQLYESAKNFLIFFTLWTIRFKKLPDGFLFWLFISMYSILRFLIEFVREPTRHGLIYGLSFGQWLNIPLIIIGLYFLFKLSRKLRRDLQFF